MATRRTKAAQAPSAKLSAPRLPAVHARTRLFGVLDRAFKAPAVWIEGPPGAGKTTLAASWLKARKRLCVWYQVDPGDADLATFFHYLGLAARYAAPRYKRPLPHLTPEFLPGLETFARRYFEELFRRLPKGSVLVLDNAQDAGAESAFNDVLRVAIETLPAHVRMLCLSRASPPPSLARLIANAQIAVLEPAVTRLTLEEARGVAAVRGIKDGTRIAAVHDRTRGWTAGLVLMLERTGADAGREAGDPQTLFDYFATEIFRRLDEGTRGLLLKSALLPKMRAADVESLTGRTEAGSVIADLQRRNYFTYRLSPKDPVYEYHPLFREFLLARLHEALAPPQLDRLRSEAARLLDASGQIEAAADLWRAAGDWDALVELILSQAAVLVEQGRVTTLQAWIGSLPPVKLGEDPWLEYWLAVCLLFRDPEEARRRFERAYQGFEQRDDGRGLYYAWAGVVHPVMMQWGNYSEIDRWLAELVALERRAPLELYPDVEPQVAYSALTLLTCAGEDRAEISRWADRMETLSGRRTVNERVRLLILIGLNIHYYWSGAIEQARLARERLVSRLGKARADPITRLQCYMALVGNSMFTGDLEFGKPWAQAGLRLGEKIGVRMSEALFIAHGVYAAEQAQDLEQADAALARYRQALFPDNRVDEAHYCYLAAGLAWQRGHLGSAREHIERGVALCEQMQLRAHTAHLRLMLAQILAEFGEFERSGSLREQAGEYARSAGNPALLAHCDLTAAWIALRQSDEKACAGALAKAFAFGQRARCAVYMGWNARMAAPLCDFAIAREIEPEYARFLIRTWHLPPPDSGMRPESWPWPARIRVLGRFSVERDEKPLAVERGAKPLELLKALVALGGRGVAEAELAEMLWPDTDGDRAHSSLKITVHRLRRLLGEECIVWSGGVLSLDTRSVWVDAWALERALGALESALLARQGGPVAALAAAALALNRGAYLRADTKPWALAAREHLRAKFLRIIGNAAEALVAEGKAADAVRCYEKSLEVDPAAERFYQGLMRCHLELGERADGLAVYRRCRDALARELALAPSPKTEALRASLLSG